MEVSLDFSFCSKGMKNWAADLPVPILEKSNWKNQYGSGFFFAINLMWVGVTFEVFNPNGLKREPLYDPSQTQHL